MVTGWLLGGYKRKIVITHELLLRTYILWAGGELKVAFGYFDCEN